MQPGAGKNGTDRVTLTWPNDAIKSESVEMMVKANGDTVLTEPDVFYFVNAPGDHKPRTKAQINSAEMRSARASDNRHGIFNRTPIQDCVAYNRDDLVNVANVSAVRDNLTIFLKRVVLFTAPAIEFGAPAPVSTAATAALAMEGAQPNKLASMHPPIADDNDTTSPIPLAELRRIPARAQLAASDAGAAPLHRSVWQ